MLDVTKINVFFNDNAKAVAKKIRDDAADVKMWKSGKLCLAPDVADAVNNSKGYVYVTVLASGVIITNYKVSEKTITLKLSRKSGSSSYTVAIKGAIMAVADTLRLDKSECLIQRHYKDEEKGEETRIAVLCVANTASGMSQAAFLDQIAGLYPEEKEEGKEEGKE